MTEINTREIAETLMIDSARRVADFIISDRVYAEVGDQPYNERLAIADEIQDLINKAKVIVEFPEVSGS
jgi:hypothetical protein